VTSPAAPLPCLVSELFRAPSPEPAPEEWRPGRLGPRLAAALCAALACVSGDVVRVPMAYAAAAPCAAAAAAFARRLETGARRIRPSDSLDLEAARALHPFLAAAPRARARYVLVTPRLASRQAVRWAAAQVRSGREAACLVAEATWSDGGTIAVAALAIGRAEALAGARRRPVPADLEAAAGDGREWTLACLDAPRVEPA